MREYILCLVVALPMLAACSRGPVGHVKKHEAAFAVVTDVMEQHGLSPVYHLPREYKKMMQLTPGAEARAYRTGPADTDPFILVRVSISPENRLDFRGHWSRELNGEYQALKRAVTDALPDFASPIDKTAESTP